MSAPPIIIKSKKDMREIKFRAWDRIGKQMIEHEHLIMTCDGFSALDEEATMFPMEEIMQFTGETTADHYGNKEIYEGDIVFNHTVNRNEAGVIEFSNDHHAYIIRYKDKKGKPQDFDEMHGVEHNLELVGNIYENKDLLN